MSKRNSKANLIFLFVTLVIGLFLSFASFRIPYTFTNYNGFFNAVRLGFDLQGGASIVFEASNKPDSQNSLNQNIEGTIGRIKLLLENQGYTEHYVYKQASNKIVVEVPVLTDTDFLFDKLNQPASFKITTERDPDAPARLEGKHISYAGYQVQQGQTSGSYNHGVAIAFNDEGTKLFAELTKEIAESNGQMQMHFYVGDNKNPINSLNADGAITNGSVFISSASMTEETAKEMSLQILSGSFSSELKIVENKIISASLGKSALTLGIIALFTIFVVGLIYLIFAYKKFGWLSAFSSLFFMLLTLFFLQAVPFVRLTLASFLGLGMGLLLNFISYFIIYQNIKKEHGTDKKLHLSVKLGQKKSTVLLADVYAVFGIVSLVLTFMASGALKGFASALLVSTAVSAFTTLLIFRFMLKNYVVLNASDAKKFNLKKVGE